MARPAKKAEHQRPSVLAFRLTAAELATFNERVVTSGLSPADFMRQAVLGHRIVVRRTAVLNPVVLAELNRIGVNLNQLTRTSNGTGRVPPDLDRLCRIIEEVVMKAIEQEDADDPDHHG